AGYLSSVQINWTLALAVTAAAVVGALIGARLTSKVNPDALRKTFGWFVLAMSSVILAQEIHLAVGLAGVALTVIAGGLYLACTRKDFCPLNRLIPGRREPVVTGEPAPHTSS
ncbi:MAG: TSUP family transporter, partial [Mycobacterium sp.]|nr:TSUP family transporter [Mycobacterium sp.]